ncbi:uncharacterized protein LOC144635774 isoform X1 [Oculina patagonica]
MKGFLLSVLVFSAVLSTAYSIKCYVCKGTEDTCSKINLEADKDMQQTCPGDSNLCIRSWYGAGNYTTVSNACGTDSTCEDLKGTCGVTKAFCDVGCCYRDLCNEGSPLSFSVFLMVVCFSVGQAILK